MHKPITQADAKAAAEQGKKRAIEVSILHHEDPGKMTRGELVDAIERDEFHLGTSSCALCLWEDNNGGQCPLKENCNNGVGRICIPEYDKIALAKTRFVNSPNSAYYKTFLAAEAKMVERLKVELSKVEAEEKEKEGRGCSTCKHNGLPTQKEPCKSCKIIEWNNWEPKEKQELKHGDYGPHWIAIRTGYKEDGREEIEVYYSHGAPPSFNDNDDFIKGRLGNFFDNLASQFEVKSGMGASAKFSIDKNCGHPITMRVLKDKMFYNFDTDTIIEIGHNLIRMARTVEDKAKK